MRGDNPLVSIIIPAYNHEQYVQEAIGSLMKQTYPNLELIIIDDGSSDKTWDKIKEMREECEKRFQRVYFAKHEHRGVIHTLNKLINLANGKYLYYIASDDCAKPNAISPEVEFLEKHPDYILAVGNNEFIDENSHCIGWDNQHNSVDLEEATYKTLGDVLKISSQQQDFGDYIRLLRANHIPNGYLILKEAVQKTGGYTPEAPLEDWYMMLQLAKLGKFKYFDEILFSYRWHSSNTAKQTRHMLEMATKTYLYEKKSVSKRGNEVWLKKFEEASKKTLFSIGSFLRLYKIKTPLKRSKILEIMGRKIVLSEKCTRIL